MRRIFFTTVPVAFLALCLAGCGKSNSAAPIASTDDSAEHRDQVRENVLNRIGMQGQPVANRDKMVGSWDVAPAPLPGENPPNPTFVYHFHSDGSFDTDVSFEGEAHRDTGRWQLNADGTFALQTCLAADKLMPNPESRGGEERFFLLGLPDGRRVIWNDDGSLVLVLTPRQSP